VAAQGIFNGLGVLFALLLRSVVDSAQAGDRNVFVKYFILAAFLIFLQITVSSVIRWLNEYAKSTFENIFKKRLTETLLYKDYLRVSVVHSGEWINRLTNDTTVVANSYAEMLPGLFGMAVKLFGALIMIIALEPMFAVILIPGGALMMLFTLFFRRVIKRLHKKVQEEDGRLRVLLQDRIGSMLMIRSFAGERQTLAAAEGKMEKHKAARMKKILFSALCNLGFASSMKGIYLLGVGWCGYGILNGSISFGTFTAVIQLIGQIQMPFANITGFLPQYYAMTASAERLMEAEAFASDSVASGSPEETADFYGNRLAAIGLENVSFAYYPLSDSVEVPDKAQLPVSLQNVSLEIPKGSYVAFTGHSGCGKSTALKLLMCVFHPDSGRRYYVDNDGNRAELSAQYRRMFAYVPQGNYLMSGTVRDLVSFACPEQASNDGKLRQALEIACAGEFVERMEHGVDTLLGERGAGLSEGQMQRLAIARAIFSGSPILLLDEATSSLDAATERRLLKNLRCMTDKTVVIVTHRPAALEICDSVLEFSDNGIISRIR
jgi:ABC-type multidrug transport system, ATPase and permease components